MSCDLGSVWDARALKVSMTERKVSGAGRVATVDPGCRLLVRGPFEAGDVTVAVREEPRPTTKWLERQIEAAWQETLALAQVEGRRIWNGEVMH